MTSPVVASRVELGPYLLHSLFVHSPVLPPLPFIFPYHWPFPLLIVGGLLYAQPQLKSNLVHFKTKEIYPFCDALNGTYSNLQKSKLLTKPRILKQTCEPTVTIILRSCSQRPRFEIRTFGDFTRKSSLFAIQFQLADEFLQFVVALVRRSECQDREVGHLVAIHDSGTAEAVHRVLQGVGGRTFRCHQHRSKIKNGDRRRPQFESGTYATVDTRRGLYRWGAAGAYSGFCVRGAPLFPFPSCPLPLPSPFPYLRLPLEVVSLKPARESREAWGLGPKTNLVQSKAVRKPLVAIIFSILKKRMFYKIRGCCWLLRGCYDITRPPLLRMPLVRVIITVII